MLLERASVRGSRSTALQPLAWLIFFLFAALVALLSEHGPTWLIVLFAILSILGVAAYLGAFLYLLRNDRDALRSERFNLSKLALEKSVKGDDVAGFLEEHTKALPPSEAKSEDKH
jgi:hypothetical protein